MIATASPLRTSHELYRNAWTSSAAILYRLLTPSTRTSTPVCSNINNLDEIAGWPDGRMAEGEG